MEQAHIMLIDDNEGDLFLMNEVLDRIGINKVSILKDGCQAIRTLSTQIDCPHLIFLDINLPKKNGHEVLEFIKKQEHFKDIPIIMFSTSSSLCDIKLSFINDASGFMIKPLDFESFEKEVTQAIAFWINYSRLLEKNKIYR